MSNQALDRLRAERDQCRDTALALMEADDYDPGSEALKNLEERGVSLDGQIERIVKEAERQQSADLLDNRASRAFQRRTEERSQSYGTPQTRQSWGEAWVRSEQFESYRMKGSSGVVTIEDDVQTRALPTGLADLVAAGFKGATPQYDLTAPVAPTPLLDAIGSTPVSANAVEYVSWAKKAGSAATVAEKAAKPSVEYGPTVVPGTLEMIAAYTQLTRQLIEDHVAVRSLIDTELRREIAREEEEHAATALAAATLPTATGGGDLLAAIRVGMGTVQAAGYAPNAVLINPADLADLDITIMGATLLGPVVRQTFWGMTSIPANSQPAGTATVGDFPTGVKHFVRSEINLFVTDSHADTFLSNVFTLLAERRSLTAVVRPAALVECSAGA